MEEVIADKRLSDTNQVESDASSVHDDATQNAPSIAANDDNHEEAEEAKKSRTYKKGGGLCFDGPIAPLCSLERGAAYVGLTKIALRVACARHEMPGHKKIDPESDNDTGTWWFNVKEWDKLADELPELEPPEWHKWKSYWTYDRQKRKFSPADKKDCQTINGKRVYKGRTSKLEQFKTNEAS